MTISCTALYPLPHLAIGKGIPWLIAECKQNVWEYEYPFSNMDNAQIREITWWAKLDGKLRGWFHIRITNTIPEITNNIINRPLYENRH